MIDKALSPRATVMVVDDDPAVRDVLSRWIAADALDLLAVESAEMAWQRLCEQTIELVVLDIDLPGASGVELLGRIRRAFPETTVLMLSGCDHAKTAIRALTGGAFGYLIKPAEREEFLFHVRRGLEHRLLLHERRRHLEELQRRVMEQTLAIRSAHEETIHRLVTATTFRDEETGAHIRRTGLFSEALARAAGWSALECERIRMAAPMHDVGKIGIPDLILTKPGKLSPDEFNEMKRHTTIGANMLAGSPSPILQLGCEIALNHHERWDGTGYPNGTAGEAIPESARIVAIVDVYDALMHDRVYRPAMAEDQVLDILRQGNGTHFDPGLLANFFLIYEEIRQICAANPDDAAAAIRIPISATTM